MSNPTKSGEKGRIFHVKAMPDGRNISNQHLIYTAVEVTPQNSGWIKTIEYSAYEQCKHAGEINKLLLEHCEKLAAAIEKMCERVDVNQASGDPSGIGEYRGGPAFVVKELREALESHKQFMQQIEGKE